METSPHHAVVVGVLVASAVVGWTQTPRHGRMSQRVSLQQGESDTHHTLIRFPKIDAKKNPPPHPPGSQHTREKDSTVYVWAQSA